MSRFQPDDLLYPPLPTAEEVVNFWKVGQASRELLGLGDQKVSIEEEFADLKQRLKRTRHHRDNQRLLEKFQRQEVVFMNNFVAVFYLHKAAEFMRGVSTGLEHYLLQPFFVDQEFNRAWTDMCEAMPTQVKFLLEYFRNEKPGHMVTSEERAAIDKALHELAFFLIQRGVPPTFLWI